MASALATLALAVAAPAAGAASRASVPRGFLGVVADGPLLDGVVDVNRQFALMAASGVQSVRFSIYWDTTQPSATGMDFRAPDALVEAAARARLRMLPVLLRAPAWLRLNPSFPYSPPSAAGRAAYERFIAALVRRYGPRGDFWRAHPQLPRTPIRQWQIWNEPGGPYYWSDPPGMRGYVALLRAAHRAIRKADPGAKVVLGGLVQRSWTQLDELYRDGGRRFFDVAAIHPFTLKVSNVLRILRLARATMRRHHDARKPLLATEVTWPSAKGRTTVRYGYEVTERGQAARLRDALGRMAAQQRRLGLIGVYWTSWISYDRNRLYPFDFDGLLRFSSGHVVRKPAFYAFRRTAHRLEG